MRENKNKKIIRFDKYLFLIIFASFFMTVGYAAIANPVLNISGSTIANVQSGVFISDFTCTNGNGNSSTINLINGTMVNSTITIPNLNSSVVCSVTVYNNTTDDYEFDQAAYDSNFYSNADITVTTSISQGTQLASKNSITFTATFTKVASTTGSNVLDSYINYKFVVASQNSGGKFADYIVGLIDGKTPTNGVYDLGSGTGGCTNKLSYDDTTDTNLRYVGSNPCNYVSLGGETWRIIGVMNGMGSDPLVKLINNDFYNNGTAVALGKNNVNTWTSTTLYGNMNSLSITSNAMVESVAFYNGGPSANTVTAANFYSNEKSTLTSSIKIGLMNASDYGFATDNVSTCRSTQLSTWGSGSNLSNCVTNHNWLSYQGNVWTISAVSGRKTMYRINNAGYPYATNTKQYGLIRAVIYLKNSVLYDSGDGSSGTPYTLK